MPKIVYKGFVADALPGIRVHGDSIRIEFLFEHKPHKARFTSIKDVSSPKEFQRIVDGANFIKGQIDRGLRSNDFDRREYIKLLPESAFARSANGRITLTFGECIERWYKDQKNRIDNFTVERNTTEKRYQYLMSANLDSNHLNKNRVLSFRSLREVPVADIDVIMLKDLQRFLRHEKPRDGNIFGLAAKTVNNIFDAINVVFNYAVTDLGEIQRNPLREIKNLKVSAKKADEIQIFTDKEVDLVEEVLIQKNKDFLSEMFIFGIGTGCRKEELLALAWEDVNLDDDTVFIQRAFTAGEYKEPKEQASFRHIVMTDRARQALLSARQRTFDLIPQQFEVRRRSDGCYKTESLRLVFQNFAEIRGRIGDPKPWRDASVRKAWGLCQKWTGVKKPIVCTRHTFASKRLSNGADKYVLASQMGHASTEMIDRRYGRFIKSMSEDFSTKRRIALGLA